MSIKINLIKKNINRPKWKLSSHIEYSFHLWGNAYKIHVLLTPELLNKGSSNLPVKLYILYGLTNKSILLLSNEVSPISKTLVNFESLCCKIDVSVFLIKEPIVLKNSWNSGEDNFTFSTTAWGFERILKAVFELMFSKLIKPSLSRDRNFFPLGLWQLNVLLGNGLINDTIFF